MGNSPSVSYGEQVYRAAKAGNVQVLRELAHRAAALQPGDEGYSHRNELLEWQDEDKRTPLIVAAQKNHVQCVDLLLRSGANVQHQSTRKDGGSALHAAVHKECSKEIADLLLKSGASPFVENSAGFTALDFAVLRKNTGLVRLLEALGLFTGHMKVKTATLMGLKTGWSSRWVAAVPRNPYPNLPPSQQIYRRTLLVFQDRQHYESSTSMYLDGAKAEIIPGVEGGKETHCQLTLHSLHIHPKGGLHVKSGDGTMGHQMYFKPSDAGGSVQLEQFCQMVNHAVAPRVLGAAPSGVFPEAAVLAQRPSSSPTHPLHSGSFPAIQPWGAPGTDAAPAPVLAPAPPPPPLVHSQTGPHEDHHIPSAPPLPMGNEAVTSAPPFPVPVDMGFQHPGYFGNNPQIAPRGSVNANVADDDDDGLCVICLSAPKEAGFVHGTSVHKCCCTECARNVVENGGNQCPVCRQDIQHVIEHFYS